MACNLKTMKLVDCALIGACAVITVGRIWYELNFLQRHELMTCIGEIGDTYPL